MTIVRGSLIVAAACLLSAAATTVAAQRGGGAPPMGAPRGGGAFPFSRLELLEQNFKLTGDQKKAVKAVLDEAHKSAAPVRGALLETHTALGDAVQAGKSQDDINAAARAYAAQASAMARIEMEAIARVLAIADPELKNPAGIQEAFFMARGMFLKNKWNEIPERNIPSY
jgi:Spy/CpxP family protein refolding chaperone